MAESAGERLLRLPFYTGMDEAERARVVEAVEEFTPDDRSIFPVAMEEVLPTSDGPHAKHRGRAGAAPRIPKRVAIVQSSYIPWKGYFDLIARADEFILLDDVQYTRRDWRNRNAIKTARGPLWLTIPVESKGRFLQKVRDARICDRGWGRRHWESLQRSYSRAPCFREHREPFEELFRDAREEFLCDANYKFIAAICRLLGIQTSIRWSTEFPAGEGRSERLLSLCLQTGATEYLSGPTARAYLDTGLFEENGVRVSFMDYDGYPAYEQLYPPFSHQVSVLDMIFHLGGRSPAFMKHVLR